MTMITEDTRLRDIVRCGQFQSFRKYLIAPRAFRGMMQMYRLKDLSRFYAFCAPDGAEALNYMRCMADEGKFFYTPLGETDVGVYSYLTGENRPFVLILPGGAYADVCSLIEGYSVAKRFNELGYNAFIGNYRIGKGTQIPNPQDDVAEILTYIYDNAARWKVATEHYAVCGFSAGGHLAASWGLKNVGYAHYRLPKPAAAILCYAVITMAGAEADAGSRKNLLGKYRNDEEIRRRYSVELQADADYPATFIWQCTGDAFDNTALFTKRLEELGVCHKSVYYEGGAHGVGAGVGTPAEGWIESAAAFWEETMTEKENVSEKR